MVRPICLTGFFCLRGWEGEGQKRTGEKKKKEVLRTRVVRGKGFWGKECGEMPCQWCRGARRKRGHWEGVKWDLQLRTKSDEI